MASRLKLMPAPANTTGMVKVTDGVYAHIGGNGQTNFGLVTTNGKPVVIDNDIRVQDKFLTGMRKVTRKDAGLVLNTHHNFDHTSDNGYYAARGAVSFGVDLVREEMEREFNSGNWVKQMDGRGPKVKHLIGKLDITPPTVTFEEQIDIRYGGRLFQMIYIGHCHTKGDTVVWMPEEGVLFSGDLLTYRTQPVNRLGNFMNWIPALSLLKKFPVKYVVPGHGPLPPRGSAVIDENKTFLTRLKTRTEAALKKEGTPVKASKAVRMPEYIKWFRAGNVEPNALKMAKDLKKKR
jgi:cyclase